MVEECTRMDSDHCDTRAKDSLHLSLVTSLFGWNRAFTFGLRDRFGGKSGQKH